MTTQATSTTDTKTETLAYWHNQLALVVAELNAAIQEQQVEFSAWVRAKKRTDELWERWREMKRKVETLEGLGRAIDSANLL